jgi:trk system potassium uptake protein TrkH
MFKLYISFGEGIRQALFNIVSALSTTGYSTMSYQGWPPFALGVMILMMLIGGGIGSTAGGMKLSRVLILLKSALHNVKNHVAPEHEVSTPFYYRAQGKASITESVLKSTTGFITCYLCIFIIGSLLLTVTADVSLTDAMFEFASSLGTVGLSIGITGTTTNAATLIVEICGMILGRLEIFIVLTGLYSAFRLLFHKRKPL